MKRFICVHQHLLIRFSLSTASGRAVSILCCQVLVALCCLALSPAVRAENLSASHPQVQRPEKQKTRVRRPTVTQQKKRVQPMEEVEKKKTLNRLHRLHHAWVRNKAKAAARQRQRKVEAPKTQPLLHAPVKPTHPLMPRNAAILSLPVLQLPTPFYAGLYHQGNGIALDFGVENGKGSIYTFIAEEVTGEGLKRSIGIGTRLRIADDGTFFMRARDVLHFVPKKIGTGVRALGRGIKALRWW